MAPSATLLRPAAALVLMVPIGASAQTPAVPRQDLEAVAAALDASVREVASPGVIAFGGAATRAYVLPGVGALFVMAPRALPSRRVKVDLGRQRTAHLNEAIAQLQESLRRVREPEARAHLERSLDALRRTLAEVQRTAPAPAAARRLPWTPMPPPDAALALPDPEELAQAVQQHVEQQMRVFDEVQREQGRAWQQQWEAQMQAMTAQTDAFRREAERARAEAERALQEQLAAWPGIPVQAPPPPAAAAPAAPAAPAIAAPPQPAAVPAPPTPVAPWSTWFDFDAGEPADPDAAVAGVREAVLAVFDAEGPRLLRLAGEGSVAVAVDFVPRGPLPRRALRTLVLRVGRGDLEARVAGRLGPQEFRKRVAATEY